MHGYREVFRPGPDQDPGKIFYTITAEDAGKTVLPTTAGEISLAGWFGAVRPEDAGKRLYRVPSGSQPATWIWQAENDRQRDARISRQGSRDGWAAQGTAPEFQPGLHSPVRSLRSGPGDRPLEPGEVVEYLAASISGTWQPALFDRYVTGSTGHVYVRPLGRQGRRDAVLWHLAEVRRINPELILQARRWAADCQWIEDAEDIADLAGIQVVAGIQEHYAGGWVQFTRDQG